MCLLSPVWGRLGVILLAMRFFFFFEFSDSGCCHLGVRKHLPQCLSVYSPGPGP